MKKGADYTLILGGDYERTGVIELWTEDYNAEWENVESERKDSGLIIGVNRETGEPLLVVLEQFKNKVGSAIRSLGNNPLPWTFSLPEMGIKEKPLEDVLLAIWRKYRV
jgi:hypothetical protein